MGSASVSASTRVDVRREAVNAHTRVTRMAVQPDIDRRQGLCPRSAGPDWSLAGKWAGTNHTVRLLPARACQIPCHCPVLSLLSLDSSISYDVEVLLLDRNPL